MNDKPPKGSKPVDGAKRGRNWCPKHQKIELIIKREGHFSNVDGRNIGLQPFFALKTHSEEISHWSLARHMYASEQEAIAREKELVKGLSRYSPGGLEAQIVGPCEILEVYFLTFGKKNAKERSEAYLLAMENGRFINDIKVRVASLPPPAPPVPSAPPTGPADI
jgi:hypothetical protein